MAPAISYPISVCVCGKNCPKYAPLYMKLIFHTVTHSPRMEHSFWNPTQFLLVLTNLIWCNLQLYRTTLNRVTPYWAHGPEWIQVTVILLRIVSIVTSILTLSSVHEHIKQHGSQVTTYLLPVILIFCFLGFNQSLIQKESPNFILRFVNLHGRFR